MNMKADQKAAMAQGRIESNAISAYLNALEQNKPKRGRPLDAKGIAAKIERIQASINDPSTTPIQKVVLIQERMELVEKLASMSPPVNMEELQAQFVEHAKSFSERRGISYVAWREVGVPASALKLAGITR